MIEGLGRGEDPALVQERRDLIIAPVLRPHQVVERDAHLLEADLADRQQPAAQLLAGVGDRHARPVGLHQEGAQPPGRFGRIRIRAGQNDVASGLRPGVEDKALGAVDDPAVAGPHGRGLRPGDVVSQPGLGEGGAAENGALGHFRQPSLLLVLGPEAQQQLRAAAGPAQAAAHRGIPPAELLGDQRVFKHAQPGARIRLREMDPDESQLGGLLPDRFGKGVPFDQIFDDFLLEFAFDEVSHGLLNLKVGFVQFNGHGGSPDKLGSFQCQHRKRGIRRGEVFAAGRRRQFFR